MFDFSNQKLADYVTHPEVRSVGQDFQPRSISAPTAHTQLPTNSERQRCRNAPTCILTSLTSDMTAVLVRGTPGSSPLCRTLTSLASRRPLTHKLTFPNLTPIRLRPAIGCSDNHLGTPTLGLHSWHHRPCALGTFEHLPSCRVHAASRSPHKTLSASFNVRVTRVLPVSTSSASRGWSKEGLYTNLHAILRHGARHLYMIHDHLIAPVTGIDADSSPGATQPSSADRDWS